MRKWEQKYEEFSNSKELEEKMAILEDKINGKVAFKEEYEEFKQLSAIKENLPKVKNILQLRENLENENKEINEEIKKREARIQLNKKIENLDKQLKEYEAEWDKITTELKGELSEEEKTSKQTRLKQIETLKQKNNVEFGNCQDQLKLDAEEIAKSKFKDISTDELKEQAYQGKMKVSKCNLACNKLMQGYSWDSVEVALDKFKDERFTAKGKEAEKMRQNRAAAKSEKEQNKEVVKNENENEQVQKSESKSQSKEQKYISNEENKSLAVPEEKTIFQKIKDKLKNLTNRAKDWIMGKEEEEIEENVVEEVIEDSEKETESKETLISRLINKTKEWMNNRNKSEKEAEVAEEKKDEKKDEKKEADAVENKKEESKENEQPKKDDFKEYLKFVAENGVNITPEEKAKEDEINKTIEMLVESRRQKAQKEGKTFDEESTRKTAKAVAENSYNRKHQPTQQTTQENNGQDR